MKRSLVRYLPIAPNVAILVLAALLLSSPDTSVFEPPLLLPILNTAFLSIIPFAIAFLSGRTYIGQSRPEFLLFGCGMLVFGVASLVTGWGLPRWGHNFAVTVYNVGGFLGGLFHFGATAVLVAGRSTGTQTPRRGPGLAVVASYFSCVLAVTAISVLAAHGAFPVFFIQSQGPTIVRQIVLAAAVAAYALPAIVMVDLHATTQESLFRWYASALFLMAAGLGIVMTVKSVGSPLCWTGRAAQYAASLYFAAAMLTANQRLRKASGLQLPAYLRDLLGSRVEDSVRERTRELSELNEQLRRSEERFRLAAESAGFGFYEYDFESGETGYSAEFLKLFGLSPGATLGLNNDGIAVALHPDDRPVFLAAMTAANDPRGAGILDLEYRIVPAAGTLRWLRVRGQTTFSGRGADARPARANGIIQDITERRLREEALRRSEERYRTVADFTFDWEMWLDPEGRIIYCSPSCERITGYSSEEFMHDPGLLARIAGPDESPARRRHFTRADPGPVESFEYRILSRSGEQRWIGHVCRPVFSLDGAFVGRRVSNRDITGQKRLDDAYRSLVNLAPYGMAIIQAGRVVFVNPALIKIVRFDMDRLGEATAEELLLEVDEEYQKRVISYVTSFMAGGTVVPVLSFQLVHRDGVVRWVEARLSRIGHDGLPAVQMTLKDITSEKSAEGQLKAAHMKMRNLADHLLHAREEERQRIAREVHDELGQPLAALKMDLHWLQKRLSGQSSAVHDRLRGVIDLGETVISKVQKIASDLRPKMLDDLGLEPALQQLGADFTRRTKIPCKVTTSFPAGLVGANAGTTLYRFCQEALSNVALHSHADSSGIRLFAAGGELVLEVEDDGIGITEEQMQAQDSYGLIGLKERIEGLGGSLSINGEAGFGTSLVARIPFPKEGGLA